MLYYGGIVMDFLYLLEKLRVPVLNEFMLFITTLGEETAFLVIALVLFWCVDKYVGYYTLSVGFVGTIANQFLKLLFRIPRPWVLDGNFTILEQAREAATGYSFPSGHTQSAVGTFGSIAYATKEKWLRNLCIAIAFLVAFSRMYLGVHTPLDVVVSVAIAAGLIFALKPVVLNHNHKHMSILLAVMLLLSVGFLCFVLMYPFPADIDPHNFQSGRKNAFTLLGAFLGLIVVYIVDEKWLNFSTKAVWWAQILKTFVGLCLVLVVKTATKDCLNALLGESIGRTVRYFLTVVVAGCVWPLSFDWFSRLGQKE
ncbi:MAG: phosphatase PAP2 family protein [Ruminococcaceae bacterium]|nr:phosphatase PAP2 family protein [Oscillospiraceae bacterium]